MTVVLETARLELLRSLAAYEDLIHSDSHLVGGRPVPIEHWPSHIPLLGADTDWQSSEEDIALAAVECVQIGHLEVAGRFTDTTHTVAYMLADVAGGRQWMVKITPAGYAWIRAHDAAGDTGGISNA